MSLKLRLTIEVEYDPQGVPIEELKENLNEIAELAYKEGLLTKNSDAEVEAYTAKIDEADKVITVRWTTEDVISCAENDDIDLSEEEAIEILKRVKHGHNCEIGINWDVIRNAIHYKS